MKRSESEVRAWLQTKVAEALKCEPDQVDPAAEFDTLGVDSLTAVNLSGDLEEWLGRTLDPTLLFDFPSVDALAKHLCAE